MSFYLHLYMSTHVCVTESKDLRFLSSCMYSKYIGQVIKVMYQVLSQAKTILFIAVVYVLHYLQSEQDLG